jgi:hypothetical protein
MEIFMWNYNIEFGANGDFYEWGEDELGIMDIEEIIPYVNRLEKALLALGVNIEIYRDDNE